MTESIFTPTTPNSETPVTPEVSYVEALVGPGKKYKDMEALAKSVVDKDVFIETLKTENKQAREEINKRLTLEEFLEKTTPPNSSASKQVPNPALSEREENQREPAPRSEAPTPISPAQLQAMIREAMSAENTKNTRATNIETARNELEKTWGSAYVTQLQAKAKELGVPTDFLDDMAARAPKAFLTLVGVDSTKQQQPRIDTTPPVSNQQTTFHNVDTKVENIGGVKTSAYYDRLRETNPKEYFSTQVQIERHRDALKLGDKFFVS